MRRVEQRATGQFLKVQGPFSHVVSIPAWMVDSIVCTCLAFGVPQVELDALSDLKRLVMPAAAFANSQSENGIAWEEVNGTAQCAGADLRQANEPDIRTPHGGRDERCGTSEDYNDACPDPDAGGRALGRGAWR